MRRHWLQQNINVAREKLRKCGPVREEICRLQSEIADAFGIKELILDCGWNIRHYRGCLASFQALAHHHPHEMKILRGKFQLLTFCSFFLPKDFLMDLTAILCHF